MQHRQATPADSVGHVTASAARLQVIFHPESELDEGDEAGPVTLIDLSEVDRLGGQPLLTFGAPSPPWRRYCGFMARREARALALSLDADYDEE